MLTIWSLNFYGAEGRGPDMRAGNREPDNPKTPIFMLGGNMLRYDDLYSTYTFVMYFYFLFQMEFLI